ncbi:GNAT family N-acetyltransferase [Legionella brunensis]|uniref:N-acyltransferase YncA n=1 Tax=Legionella brunensis TaxID=29422 RepID=A0A0W0S4W4_9GAMM|nr:GNAT family N-acetyltransferase [Legionella brunensis]KTC78105.1 N-acyltransferase YncA [Legionella brunensis]
MLDFKLREATLQDWPQILSIYNYYIVNTVFNFELQTYCLSSRAAWFENFQEGSPYQLLIIVDKQNTVIGYAATTPFNPVTGYHTSFNVSVYCHPEFIGLGLGTHLLNELIERNTYSSMAHRLYAGITIPNDSSMNLFQKFNFVKVAHFTDVGYKFDRYWDVVWFERCI